MLGHLGMHAWVGKAIMALLAWSSPWYWVVLAVALATVGLLHPVPWTLKDDEESFVAHLVLWVRKAAAYTALWGILAIPLLVYCTFVLSADTSSGQASSVFLEWGADRLRRYWMMVVGAFAVGLALRFLWDRYAVPVLSKYWRSLRIEQETDKLVDAREEVATLKAKEFKPEDYFVDGKIFYGLDDDGQPIYFDLDRFRTTHHAILGPTNYGKGIVLQSIFKQCIRFGFGIFYVDPKGDNWLSELLGGCRRVVGANRAPCRAKPVDVGAQDPSAHIRIDASVEQLLPRDAIAGQPWQMRGIDLHKAQVLRAITISIDGQRIHVRFMQRDAAQECAIDAVVRRCVVQAICVGS